MDNSAPSTDATPTTPALPALQLETAIKQYITRIDRLSEEYTAQKDLLDDYLNNDVTYKTHSDTAKEANKVKNGTKAQLMKAPTAAGFAAKMKELKDEVKDLKALLSNSLVEYQKLTGVNQIEDDNGQVHEIVYVAKVVKKG